MAANTTITYNGYDLSDIVTYIPSMSDHQSAPKRENAILKLAKQDGAKLISSWWLEKYITILGAIQADSQDDLESKIDEFKMKLAPLGKNLDVSWDGVTRRYVATVSDITIIRDSDNRDWCGFSIQFVVPTGFGNATTAESGSVPNITDPTYTDSLDIVGSAPASPILTFTVNAATDMTNLEFSFTNSDGQTDTIAVPETYSAADEVTIDFATYAVQYNGVTHEYTGTWPEFLPGSSDYTISITSSSHDVDFDYIYYPAYL